MVMIMLHKMSIVSFCLLALLMTACGDSNDSSEQSNGLTGPSYGGIETQATIDGNNAHTLAIAAADGASTGDNNAQLTELFQSVAGNLQSQGTGITAQGAVSSNCGGTATYPDNMDQQQSPISGTISFNSFCLGTGESGQLIVDGQANFMAQIENNELISLAITLSDFVISYNGSVVTINSTLALSQVGMLFETSTDFIGSEGRTLRVENLAVSGNRISGVNITGGRIYHPNYGYVDIETTETITFTGCDNGKPATGSLLLTGSDSTAALDVLSCTTYQVCVNGITCTTHSWE